MTQDWTLEEALAWPTAARGAGGSRGHDGPAAGGKGGGALPAADLAEIAAALPQRYLSVRPSGVTPGLRTEEAPPPPGAVRRPPLLRPGRRPVWPPLWRETYGVRPGGVSASGRFAYRITGCMKNCPNGPSLRWDGALHSRADEALIRALVDEGGGRPSLDSFPPLLLRSVSSC